MEYWIDQLVAGYRVRSMLAEDSVGLRYRAFHTTQRTDVVFRVLAQNLGRQKEIVALFTELAKSLLPLEHPGIAKSIDHGVWHDQPYLVTDHVPGVSVRQVLSHRQDPLGWADVLLIGRQVASGLEYAHGRSIYHLGVRPENIMLTQKGTGYQAVLLEVGMGKLLEASIRQGFQPKESAVLAYLAPEQFVAARVGAKTDVYSLGIMFYEMITGELPFEASTAEQAAALHLKAEPRRLSVHRIDVPPDFEEVVMAMLAKQPRDRPEMSEVKQKLDDVRHQLSITQGSRWESIAGGVVSAEDLREESQPVPAAVRQAPRELGAFAELHISRKGAQSSVVPLANRQRVLIGREAGCDIQLEDRHVSRRHCEIYWEGDQAMVRDLASTSGTFLGKTKLLPRQPEPILPGTPIRVPPFSIRLETAAPVAPPPEPAPAPARKVKARDDKYVSIVLNEPEVAATPGSAPGFLVAQLQNLTNIVDHFSLRVFGIPSDWVTTPGQAIQLNPRQQESVNLTFHPPPEPTTTSGTHPIQVFVHSREQGSVIAQADAVLVVGSFHRFEAQLSPTEVETRTRAQLEVTIANKGNAVSDYTVTAADNARALMFEVEPMGLELAPAASEVARVKAAPQKANWIGSVKMYTVTVTVTPGVGSPQPLMAQFRQRAWLPRWLPMLLLLLCCAAAALAAAYGPKLWGVLNPTPTLTITPSLTSTATPSLTPTPSFTPSLTPNVTATWEALDSDGDGLLNGQEISMYGTDPFMPDTDSDGLMDGDEISIYKTDPTDNDTDNDTWLDGEEVQRSLELFGPGPILCPNPANPDSDVDGLVDRLDPDPCNLPTATPSVTPTITPVPSFGLGGQIRSNDHLGEMVQAGMTWIKKQVKFGVDDRPAALAEDINTWHNQGFKVLLSVLGHKEDLQGGSGYYDVYANYVGGLAEAGADAIEIWNEMNIEREWPAGQISPSAYVDLLSRAAAQIRARGPGVLVISGAPAPTGVDDNVNVWADDRYVRGMAAAGAGRFADCIGIHYNEGIIAPSETSGDPRSEHYTRYFWGMVNTYWDAFGGTKPVCFTELGYLSPDGLGALPGNFAWALDTSVFEQAEWLAEAVTLSAASGKVKLVIVWNVDFEVYGDDPQAGYAIIRPDGSCPACGKLLEAMTLIGMP
jgi:hypothetical protein